MAFDVSTEATWLRSRLEGLAARPVWGESKIHLRIALPNIRQLVGERKASIESATDEEAGALADTLWNGVTYDEMALAVTILRLRPALVTPERIERWRPDLDGWTVTDDLAAVVRKWVAAAPDARFPLLDGLVAETGAWTRRLALLSTVALAREGREPDRILGLVGTALDDDRPTVERAVSTVLRELGVACPDEVLGFLDDAGDRLPARTRLEVRNKIRTGRKDTPRSGRSGARKARAERARKKASGSRTRRPPGRRTRGE